MYARERHYVKKTCEKFGKSKCMLSQRAKKAKLKQTTTVVNYRPATHTAPHESKLDTGQQWANFVTASKQKAISTTQRVKVISKFDECEAQG